MSALSSARTMRGRSSEPTQVVVGRGPVVVLRQPARRFLDEWRRPRRSTDGPRLRDLLGRQMITAERNRDMEGAALARLALGAETSPPCSSASSSTSARPMPDAFEAAALGALDAVEAVEQPRQLRGGNSGAGVAHRQLARPRGVSSARPRISPSKVNLKAFERRLRTIFSHIPDRRRPARKAAGIRP